MQKPNQTEVKTEKVIKKKSNQEKRLTGMVMIIDLIIGLIKIDIYRYIISHDSVTKHLVVLVLLLLLLSVQKLHRKIRKNTRYYLSSHQSCSKTNANEVLKSRY